jgi:hypothetical protein
MTTDWLAWQPEQDLLPECNNVELWMQVDHGENEARRCGKHKAANGLVLNRLVCVDLKWFGLVVCIT